LKDAATVVEIVRPGTTRQIVDYLLKLAVPPQEILRLRLGEPEEILSYCEMDKKQPAEAVNWKGMKNAIRAKPVSKKRVVVKKIKITKKSSRRKTYRRGDPHA
jgi:hypothetical protein